MYHNGFSGYIESIDNTCIQIHTCDDMARRRWKMENEEYMNRKSRHSREERQRLVYSSSLLLLSSQGITPRSTDLYIDSPPRCL